jgi:Methyltransferase domain
MINPEITSFQGLWAGGYYAGDPTNPNGRSDYSEIDTRFGYADQNVIAAQKNIRAKEVGFVSTLYATYLIAIRNRVRGKTVLEIGPGRGAWTKAILSEGASLVYALDALPPEHNGFFDFIGENNRHVVTYVQVTDFNCEGVPDNSIDYFFSFGCFCHISRAGTKDYFANIYSKMTSGADGYVMISDYEKRDRAWGTKTSLVEDETPTPGRWYHLGDAWFCNMIEDCGFEVIDRDIGTNLRDPIVFFRRR